MNPLGIIMFTSSKCTFYNYNGLFQYYVIWKIFSTCQLPNMIKVYKQQNHIELVMQKFIKIFKQQGMNFVIHYGTTKKIKRTVHSMGIRASMVKNNT